MKTRRIKVLWNIIILGQKQSMCNSIHILGLCILEQNSTNIMDLQLQPYRNSQGGNGKRSF